MEPTNDGAVSRPDPTWVLVTIGETAKALAESANGQRPRGEESILRTRFGTVHSMNEWRPNRTGSMAWQVLFALRTVASLGRASRRRDAPSVVYCTEEFPGLIVVALLAFAPLRALRRLPVVLLVHNVSSRKRRVLLERRRLRDRVTHLICLSESSSAILTDQLHVHPDRLSVVGSRVDCTFFAPAGGAEDGLVVSAGAINRDYATLIGACASLDVDLAIAADTAWRHSLGELPAEMRGERLEMRSYGTYLNLRELYVRSTLMVVPLVQGSFASGQTVILEGMAMGKAVITSDIDGRSDFIDDGVTGIYVPPHDVDALRAAIVRLLGDPALRSRIGAAARARVEGHYRVEAYAERILAVCALAAAR